MRNRYIDDMEKPVITAYGEDMGKLSTYLQRKSESAIRVRRNRSRRGGSVLVVAAVGFVFICGCGAIAVDYGILVSDANRMQRACDAAVLAGVQELKKTGDSAADEIR